MRRRETLQLGLAALPWLGVSPARGQTRATPEWILPVDSARAVARRERRPLLIVSLNGNLDGTC